MTRVGTAAWLFFVAVLAAAGARPYAGSWHDGSRLAAVESLGDRGTFVIDESVFVRAPSEPPFPYPADRPDLLADGTKDKLLIGGHFFSDKSPVPSVLTAAVYRAWKRVGGPPAAERPDLFAYVLTVATAGGPAVLAAWGVVVLGRRVGLAGRAHVVFSISFVVATVLPAYTRHVNPHLPFLAAAVWLCVRLAGPRSTVAAIDVGVLAGLGYTLDLGVGPALFVALVPYVLGTWGWRSVVAVSLGAAPWVVAHHYWNYQTGGTLGPANTVAEYLRWPGSPFADRDLTGGLKHTPGQLALYLGDLLVGKKGFLTHNPPLLLATLGGLRLLARREDRTPVAFAFGWATLAVLVYAATSTNLSGLAASVRWFVPLLAPGWWALGLVLKREPGYAADLAWLTVAGVPVAALMWWAGPWMPRMVPGLWGWVALAGVGWLVVRWRASRPA